jgi:hypothetical protein
MRKFRICLIFINSVNEKVQDLYLFVCLMVFNAPFNSISVLLVEETGGSGENHRPVANLRQTLSHNVIHFALIEIRTHNISGDTHRLHR